MNQNNLTSNKENNHNCCRGGGVGKHFSAFTADKQVEKTGSKSDLAFLRYEAPIFEVFLLLLVKLEL